MRGNLLVSIFIYVLFMCKYIPYLFFELFLFRYMPLLNMIQEIHFKIMRRIRINRDAMAGRDLEICPRIKQKLDIAVKASRKWQATWDGDKKYMVRQGTRSVTVNLEEKTCDCRAWELTGIPCPHAVAAIHDRRHQPATYVSHFYSKQMYLKAYSYSLGALRGEDFWEVTDKAPMLPPDMPKKLRGRPKKLRRREAWEDASANRSKSKNVVQGLQKMTSGKKMHCSNCRQAGHKKPKCPLLQVPNEQPENEGDNNQEQTNESVTTEKEQVHQEPEYLVADKVGNEQTKKKGGKASKLTVRRKSMPGIVFREPDNQVATQQSAVSEVDRTFKGKEKLFHSKRKERPFWMQKLKKKTTEKVASDCEKIGASEDDTDEVGHRPHWMDVQPIPNFKEKLIGLGFAKLFMPTPGFAKASHVPTGTPSVDTPPQASIVPDQVAEEDDYESGDDYEEAAEPELRRSNRIWLKTKFNFKNTPDNPVSLDDD